jgi:hypothetical protein
MVCKVLYLVCVLNTHICHIQKMCKNEDNSIFSTDSNCYSDDCDRGTDIDTIFIFS